MKKVFVAENGQQFTTEISCLQYEKALEKLNFVINLLEIAPNVFHTEIRKNMEENINTIIQHLNIYKKIVNNIPEEDWIY